MHFAGTAPEQGQMAPDFTLPRVDGEGTITLSRLRGRPTVMLFGSLTCTPFRTIAPELRKLHRDFGHAANFLLVYMREAHSSDEWSTPDNEALGIAVAQPTTIEQRIEVAATCRNRLRLPFDTVVDGMDDAVAKAYAAWPVRMYVIGPRGRVVYRGAPIPKALVPSEVRAILRDDLKVAPAPTR